MTAEDIRLRDGSRGAIRSIEPAVVGALLAQARLRTPERPAGDD